MGRFRRLRENLRRTRQALAAPPNVKAVMAANATGHSVCPKATAVGGTVRVEIVAASARERDTAGIEVACAIEIVAKHSGIALTPPSVGGRRKMGNDRDSVLGAV